MIRKIYAILLLLVSPSLWAAEYNVYYVDGVRVITMEGEIGILEGKKIDDYLVSDSDSPQIVVLNLEGGSAFAGKEIAYKLRRRNSYIIAGGYCLSACLRIFVGGTSLNRRYAMGYSTFGFHATRVNGVISPFATALAKNYLGRFMNSTWIQQHDYMFEQVEITAFNASDMATNDSDLIREENLVLSIDPIIDDILGDALGNYMDNMKKTLNKVDDKIEKILLEALFNETVARFLTKRS